MAVTCIFTGYLIVGWAYNFYNRSALHVQVILQQVSNTAVHSVKSNQPNLPLTLRGLLFKILWYVSFGSTGKPITSIKTNSVQSNYLR
jgi:hypothetical protein